MKWLTNERRARIDFVAMWMFFGGAALVGVCLAYQTVRWALSLLGTLGVVGYGVVLGTLVCATGLILGITCGIER